LVLVAEEGLRLRAGLDGSLQAISHLSDCSVQRVPGKHHTHMEEGAEIIATKVVSFLEGASEGATAEERV